MPLLRSSIDRQFLRFCRTGDPAALGEVFDRTAAELLRVACYLSGNRADAEDLVQRTFLAAIESRATFAARARALPWLLGILANHARRLQRERRRPPTIGDEPALDPVAVAAQHELDERLTRLRGELGAPYAEVLQLHLEQGLSAKEIAARLSRPAGTVRTQLVRALAQLRERLPEGFVGALLPFVGAGWPAPVAGIASLRAIVMHAAGRAAVGAKAATAGVSMVVFGSWLVSKKIAVVVPVLVLMLGLGGYLLWSPGESGPPRELSAAVAQSHGLPGPAVVAAEQRVVVAASAPIDAVAGGEAEFARVRVHVRWQHDGVSAVGVGVFASNGDDVDRRDAVTDADGCAELPHLMPGAWTIGTELGGKPQACELRAGQAATIDLVAERNAVVTGVVVDAGERPVADARIWLSAVGDWRYGHEVSRTDAEGRFEVAISSLHFLGARKHGFAPSHTVQVHEGGSRDRVVLRLRRDGGDVRGVVLDPHGAPIAWAKVLVGEQLNRVLGTDAEGENLPRGIEVTTGTDGRFVAEGVPAGLCELRAWAAGFAPCISGVDVPNAGAAQATLTMGRGATVQGTVRDGNGALLAGIAVRWGDEFEFCHGQTTSDARGEYLLHDLPAGTQELVAARGSLQCRQLVRLVAGGVAVWDPALGVGHSVHGRLLGPDGAPLSGFTVAAIGPSSRDAKSSTDAEGQFELPEVGADAVVIKVLRELHVLATRPNVMPGDVPIVITLSGSEMPTAFLVGRLTDEQGQPVVATVFAMLRDASEARGYSSDAAGTFRLGPLRAGSYQLNVQSETLCRRKVDVELVAGESKDLGSIVLQAPGAAKFTVTVFGRPAPSGYVRLSRSLDDWCDTIGIEHGEALHRALPPGPLLVTAEYQGLMQSAEITIVAGVTVEAALDLQRTHRATISMSGQSEWTAADRDAVLIAHRPDGSFAGQFGVVQLPGPPTFFCDLPAGRYELQLRIADGRTATTNVDLTADSTRATIEPRATGPR